MKQKQMLAFYAADYATNRSLLRATQTPAALTHKWLDSHQLGATQSAPLPIVCTIDKSRCDANKAL